MAGDSRNVEIAVITAQLRELRDKFGELEAKMQTGFERLHVGVEAIRDLLTRKLGSDD